MFVSNSRSVVVAKEKPRNWKICDDRIISPTYRIMSERGWLYMQRTNCVYTSLKGRFILRVVTHNKHKSPQAGQRWQSSQRRNRPLQPVAVIIRTKRTDEAVLSRTLIHSQDDRGPDPGPLRRRGHTRPHRTRPERSGASKRALARNRPPHSPVPLELRSCSAKGARTRLWSQVVSSYLAAQVVLEAAARDPDSASGDGRLSAPAVWQVEEVEWEEEEGEVVQYRNPKRELEATTVRMSMRMRPDFSLWTPPRSSRFWILTVFLLVCFLCQFEWPIKHAES